MAIVTSARPAQTTVPPVLPPPYVAPRTRLIDRFQRYSVLVAVIWPTAGIALAVATLRRRGVDPRQRRQAKYALATAVAALVTYTLVLLWLVQIILGMLTQLVALRG